MNQHPQHRLVFPDEGDTIAYGSGRAWKKWAVHLVAGPARKPVYKKTVYVRTRTAEAARASPGAIRVRRRVQPASRRGSPARASSDASS